MIQAVGKRIIAHKWEEKLPKGTLLLIAPDRNQPPFVQVIAVGSEVGYAVDVGDLLILQPFAGFTFEVDGQEYISLSEDEILALIREEQYEKPTISARPVSPVVLHPVREEFGL